MSKGGWAKLRQQQQPPYTYSNTTTLPTTSPPPRPSILPVDQGNPIRASNFLRIVRQWKAFSAKSLSRQSSTSSSNSCSILNFVPLSCISSSSFQSPASHLEEEGDSNDEGKFYDVDIPSDSTCWTGAKTPTSSPLHYQTVKVAQPSDWPQSSACQPQYTAKERVDSLTCEGKTRPLPRRALSCPKLMKSPLRSFTPSPICMHGGYAQEEEASKSPRSKKKEGAGRGGNGTKLWRSSSSPLSRFNASKQASYTPKGYLALYVGKERKRFLVKANVVNHPMFSVLLEKAKEEFGFDQKGALNIPCDIAFFEHIMLLVESNHKSYF